MTSHKTLLFHFHSNAHKLTRKARHSENLHYMPQIVSGQIATSPRIVGMMQE